jgi:group I intron endonuclease
MGLAGVYQLNGPNQFGPFRSLFCLVAKMRKGIIYLFTNLKNGKKYVGQTRHESSRKSEHKRMTSKTMILHAAFRKYGYDNFSYKRIFTDIESQVCLNCLEIMSINAFKSLSPDGYNLRHGGQDGVWTEEARLKMSLLMKGRPGKPVTEEAKQKIREARKKQIIPKEVYQRIAEKTKGMKRSDAIKKKLSDHALFHRSKEHLENLYKNRRRREVRCIETGIVYASLKTAASFFGAQNGTFLIAQITGKRPTAYGFHWEYVT